MSGERRKAEPECNAAAGPVTGDADQHDRRRKKHCEHALGAVAEQKRSRLDADQLERVVVAEVRPEEKLCARLQEDRDAERPQILDAHDPERRLPGQRKRVAHHHQQRRDQPHQVETHAA